MDGEPTPAWWPTRILLAVGIGAVLTIGFGVWFGSQGEFRSGGGVTDDRLSLLGLPFDVVIYGIASLVALVGLVWMIRIFRGPRDEPPLWRYRDR